MLGGCGLLGNPGALGARGRDPRPGRAALRRGTGADHRAGLRRSRGRRGRLPVPQVQAAGPRGLIVELVASADPERSLAIEALRKAARGRTSSRWSCCTGSVRFVEITEVVHRMLVSDQLAALERSRMIHEVFTALSLQSATEEGIVARAAELIGAPVVLEDVAHLVLGFDAGPQPDPGCLRTGPDARAGSATWKRPDAGQGRRAGCRPRWGSRANAGAGWWFPGNWATTRTRPWCSSAPGRPCPSPAWPGGTKRNCCTRPAQACCTSCANPTPWAKTRC